MGNMFKFLRKLLDSNDKDLTRYRKVVAEIEEKSQKIVGLTDAQILKKTLELKERFNSGSTLDEILPEAYALVRETADRIIGERHYDVQLVAAIALHEGKVAEQKTGEGKTLSAIPALYLNALSGRGVHLVTVNDYLARRDAGWMGPVYHKLGLSVAAIISEQSFIFDPEFEDPGAGDFRLRHLRPVTRKEAYAADITYGVNSEFGFDYLRDNMVSDVGQLAQRGHHYAIVDEVDSVLIDEARTPHIISAPDMEPTQRYYEVAKLVDKLTSDTDYVVDEKLRTAHLTDHGIVKVEKMLGLGNIYEEDFETVHLLEAALKARALFHKDKEYIVKDNQVIIVDEFTGRLLMGRRFSEGLHQAIEAKENVPIQHESKTLATVSLQNYFRMYEKLSGMTGTAVTEAEEFRKIYNLDVVVVPTHRSVSRKDFADSVYKTPRAKYAAIVNEIIECHKKGQPVLVGTTSIEKNEIISEFLKRKNIPHQVLNAKNHLREALIIAEAGKKGAVTVATNMAGRGVDIILGGSKPDSDSVEAALNKKEHAKLVAEWQRSHEDVVAAGGLHVIGTERHESRRIDNQLRGRAGRQGDPGSSRFYVSLEDDIMRLFGGEQVARLMDVFKLPEDVPLEHAMVSRAIEQAQMKVEGFHFDSRKHLVEYDDVLSKQREIVYKLRKAALTGEALKEQILEAIEKQVKRLLSMTLNNGMQESDATGRVITEITAIIPFESESQKGLEQHLHNLMTHDAREDFLVKLFLDTYEQREKQITPEVMRQVERWVRLSVVDNLWMDHLTAIDDLREGIGLRGYGQRDPLVEYKNEAYSMFERLMMAIDSETVGRIYKVNVQLAPDQSPLRPTTPTASRDYAGQASERLNIENLQVTKITKAIKQAKMNVEPAEVDRQLSDKKQQGRNDPCWCGSGKKWKKCHYPKIG